MSTVTHNQSWNAWQHVERRGAVLVFSGARRRVDLTGDLLGDFLALGDADGDTVRAFAERYGALHECSAEHSLGRDHSWLWGEQRPPVSVESGESVDLLARWPGVRQYEQDMEWVAAPEPASPRRVVLDMLPRPAEPRERAMRTKRPSASSIPPDERALDRRLQRWAAGGGTGESPHAAAHR